MEDIRTEEIASLLKEQLNDLNIDLDVSEVGEVIYVGDGVSRIQGLENVLSSELLEFPKRKEKLRQPKNVEKPMEKLQQKNNLCYDLY